MRATARRAGEHFEVRGPGHDHVAPVPNFVVFAQDDDSQPLTGALVVLTVVDDDGRARFNVPFATVTFAELEHARAAGVLPGDPSRAFYVTHPAVGNGVLAPLLALAVGLRAIWAVLEGIATIEDNLGFAQRVLRVARGRLAPAVEVVERHRGDWESRGANAQALREMLGDRPQHPVDIAELLGCEEPEAQAVLWAFGFAEAEPGLWRPGADDAARVLEPLYDELELAYNLGHDDFEQNLRARVAAYLASGQRAPRRFVDAQRFGDEQTARTMKDLDDSDELDDRACRQVRRRGSARAGAAARASAPGLRVRQDRLPRRCGVRRRQRPFEDRPEPAIRSLRRRRRVRGASR